MPERERVVSVQPIYRLKIRHNQQFYVNPFESARLTVFHGLFVIRGHDSSGLSVMALSVHRDLPGSKTCFPLNSWSAEDADHRAAGNEED